jgi:hypothetical protein
MNNCEDCIYCNECLLIYTDCKCDLKDTHVYQLVR